MNRYPLNLYRFYPFKYAKKIPIEDIFFEVSGEDVESCYIKSISRVSLIIADQDGNNLIEIKEPLTELLVFEGGFIRFNSIAKFPTQEFSLEDTEFIDCIWQKSINQGVKKLSVKGEDLYTLDGLTTNLKLSYDGDCYRLDNYADNEGNYLKKFSIMDDFSKHISIYGTELIQVSGNSFGTMITDPMLNCPTVFSPGSRGDDGDKGPDGANGQDGQDIFDYMYDPNTCAGDCDCLPGDPSCINPYSADVCIVTPPACVSDIDLPDGDEEPEPCRRDSEVPVCTTTDVLHPVFEECSIPADEDFTLDGALGGITSFSGSFMRSDSYEPLEGVLERFGS